MALLALLACERPSLDGAALVTEQATLGDTVVVRTLSGSDWGEDVRLVEELRIGERDGDQSYSFGEIRGLAVGTDGSITAIDGATQSVRTYDSTGTYLRTTGRTGAGPGEYRDVVGVVIHRSGDLLVRDPALGRIVRYSESGVPVATWPLQSGLYAADMLSTDSAGTIYAKVLTGPIRPNAPWPMGTIRFDANGTLIDTVLAPTWHVASGDPGPYDPEILWTWHPHGYLVTAFGADYAIELRRSSRSVLRIERPGQPRIPVPEGERAELEAIQAANRRDEPDEAGAEALRSIPKMKPMVRAIATGSDGRIWVRPHTPSVESDAAIDSTLPANRRPRRWTEAVVWDVFEPDGRYLGRVHLPPKSEMHVMRGEHIWGVIRDQDDVPSIVRWRIVVLPGDP